MNRVRKISMEILDKYEGSFGENFEDNKNTLMEMSIITSKELKNKIAGFITKTIKRAAREEQKRQADQKAREEEAAELARLENAGGDVVDAAPAESDDSAPPADAAPLDDAAADPAPDDSAPAPQDAAADPAPDDSAPAPQDAAQESR